MVNRVRKVKKPNLHFPPFSSTTKIRKKNHLSRVFSLFFEIILVFRVDWICLFEPIEESRDYNANVLKQIEQSSGCLAEQNDSEYY